MMALFILSALFMQSRSKQVHQVPAAAALLPRNQEDMVSPELPLFPSSALKRFLSFLPRISVK